MKSLIHKVKIFRFERAWTARDDYTQTSRLNRDDDSRDDPRIGRVYISCSSSTAAPPGTEAVNRCVE